MAQATNTMATDRRIHLVRASFDELSKIATFNGDAGISVALGKHSQALTDAAMGPFHFLEACEEVLAKEAEAREQTKNLLKTKLAEIQKEAMVKMAQADGFIDELTKIAESTGDLRLKYIVAHPEMTKEAIFGLGRVGKALTGFAGRVGAKAERGAAAVGTKYRAAKQRGAQALAKFKALPTSKKVGLGLGVPALAAGAAFAPVATGLGLAGLGAVKGIGALGRAAKSGYTASAAKAVKDAKFIADTAKGGAVTIKRAPGVVDEATGKVLTKTKDLVMPEATALAGQAQRKGFQQAAGSFDDAAQFRTAQKLMKQTGKPIRNQDELNAFLSTRRGVTSSAGGRSAGTQPQNVMDRAVGADGRLSPQGRQRLAQLKAGRGAPTTAPAPAPATPAAATPAAAAPAAAAPAEQVAAQATQATTQSGRQAAFESFKGLSTKDQRAFVGQMMGRSGPVSKKQFRQFMSGTTPAQQATRSQAQAVESSMPGAGLTDKAKTWWSGLSAGEKQMLMGGVVAGAGGTMLLS